MSSSTGVEIPEELLQTADKSYPWLGYTSRSELIRDALLSHLQDHRDDLPDELTLPDDL